MTKERLGELIKQGGTVYEISYGKVWEMPLINDEKNHCDISCNKLLHFHELLEFNNSLDNRWTDYYVGLDELFESKEQAEWICKTHTERTERFEPPMWEEIKNTYGFRFIYYDDIIEFTVNYSTMLDGVEFNTQKIAIRNLDERELLFVEKATKKNYEKACEIVRDLFKGESNGKNS